MKTFIKTLGFVAALSFALFPGQRVSALDNNNAYTGGNPPAVANNSPPSSTNTPTADTPSGPITANPTDNGNTLSNQGVTFQTFYDQLSPLGTWVQTNQYGYVFQPTVNDPNWRPYTYGHWVHTNDGMMWNSDEPFGWATYHYGRWADLADYGWVWIPGYTWAPAWVSWRESDEDYGWAPLPPEAAVGIDFADGDFGFGFHIGDDCDLAYDIGPWWYNFCPVVYIGDPYPWRHFRDRRDNFALIGNTRNITNINVANGRNGRFGQFGRVNSGGPGLAALNARSQTPIRTASLTSASTLAENGRMHGRSLSVFAPSVDPSTANTARPHSVAQTLATTNVNHGANINDPLTVNSHVRSLGATSTQVQAATQAQGNLSAGARVATVNTHPTRTLSQPLTSLHANTVNAPTHHQMTREGGATPNVPHTTSAQAPTQTHVAPSAQTDTSFFHSFRPSGSNASVEGTQHATVIHQSTAQAVHRSNAAVHHESTASVIPHESRAPSFHATSAPAFHPQSSFHSAPAVHSSGGGGAAAHFSGGAVHASSGGGGGHSGGGGGSGGNKHH